MNIYLILSHYKTIYCSATPKFYGINGGVYQRSTSYSFCQQNYCEQLHYCIWIILLFSKKDVLYQDGVTSVYPWKYFNCQVCPWKIEKLISLTLGASRKCASWKIWDAHPLYLCLLYLIQKMPEVLPPRAPFISRNCGIKGTVIWVYLNNANWGKIYGRYHVLDEYKKAFSFSSLLSLLAIWWCFLWKILKLCLITLPLLCWEKEYYETSATAAIEEAEEKEIPPPPETPQVKEEPPILVEDDTGEPVDEPKEDPPPVIQPDPPSLIGDLLVSTMILSSLLSSVCNFNVELLLKTFLVLGFRWNQPSCSWTRRD